MVHGELAHTWRTSPPFAMTSYCWMGSPPSYAGGRQSTRAVLPRMRSATATGAAVGSGLLRTVTVTWPSAAGRPGASRTRTATLLSLRALSEAETVSWQPLTDAVTPTPETTWLDCTEHCGEVSGLSRYWARFTVRLVPAMRPSTVTGRIVAIGGALVTRTRIVKVSAPPLALTATAPVVPARAAAWALRTTCRPPWPTCARSTRSAAGSQVASY